MRRTEDGTLETGKVPLNSNGIRCTVNTMYHPPPRLRSDLLDMHNSSAADAKAWASDSFGCFASLASTQPYGKTRQKQLSPPVVSPQPVTKDSKHYTKRNSPEDHDFSRRRPRGHRMRHCLKLRQEQQQTRGGEVTRRAPRGSAGG